MTQPADNSFGAVIERLFKTIEARRDGDPEASYTASLLRQGRAHCARKFGEEAIETVIEGAAGDKKSLTAESADALYHLLVLLAVNGVTPGDIAAELARREGRSGHDEKASR